MPKIKIEKVISFSTEDPVFPASNILDPDPSKKWKCQSAGEKSANLVLQLEKATAITGIDIGNEHSAYIEVLVGRSGSSEDYKVLLVMSSFMTPSEARQGTNPTKVRMFTHDQLSSPERDEKWDRIKIVCTQPFNRHVQYGLAFVSLASSEEKADAIKPHIGKFLVRSESPPANLSAGSLFARRNELEDKKPLSAAAAIREASVSPAQKLNSKKLKVAQSLDKDVSPSTSRNRQQLLYNDDDIEPNTKIDTLIEKRDKEKKEKEAKEFLESLEKEAKLQKQKKQAEEAKKKQTTPNKPSSSDQANGESSSKRKLNKMSPRKKQKVKKRGLPFHELLKGVVFTISGIQNPERGNIRSMALSMGAKYKPDWENSCTHLVCAFAKTPKFNQVRGRGEIVTRQWIPDCYAQRKRLPWRRYALIRMDQNRPESEEEIVELNEDESDDADANDNSWSEAEMETAQKKFKKNGVIRDSPSSTPSPTFSNVEVDKSGSPTRQNGKTGTELNIYDCDTEEEEDFCLKTTTGTSANAMD